MGEQGNRKAFMKSAWERMSVSQGSTNTGFVKTAQNYPAGFVPFTASYKKAENITLAIDIVEVR